jgi:hypothetical protein
MAGAGAERRRGTREKVAEGRADGGEFAVPGGSEEARHPGGLRLQHAMQPWPRNTETKSLADRIERTALNHTA